ncbi:hypothetical protein MCAV_07000 [[Mycoplasma] cavipharyngis]|uniref:hypothetical protein n=1 Tax=[Mycoplasma] cavipharyngis TaxID=92757 RepID=UPI003704045C
MSYWYFWISIPISLALFFIFYWLNRYFSWKDKLILSSTIIFNITSFLSYLISIVFLFQNVINNNQLLINLQKISYILAFIANTILVLMLVNIVLLQVYYYKFHHPNLRFNWFLLIISLILFGLLNLFYGLLFDSPSTFNSNNVTGLFSFLILIPVYFLQTYYLLILLKFYYSANKLRVIFIWHNKIKTFLFNKFLKSKSNNKKTVIENADNVETLEEINSEKLIDFFYSKRK